VNVSGGDEPDENVVPNNQKFVVSESFNYLGSERFVGLPKRFALVGKLRLYQGRTTRRGESSLSTEFKQHSTCP